jgi:hypothetical protein
VKSRRRVNSNVMFLLLLKPRSFLLPVLLAFVFVGSASSQTKTGAPTQVVRSFYRYHFSHDHNFLKRNISRRRQWLSPVLFRLLMNEFRRDEEYASAHPGYSYVPYMEGDPFTDSSEFPTSFRIGHVKTTGSKSIVNVVLLWSARSSRGRDQKNLEIRLSKVRGKWLVDNIVNHDDRDDLVVTLNREQYLP